MDRPVLTGRNEPLQTKEQCDDVPGQSQFNRFPSQLFGFSFEQGFHQQGGMVATSEGLASRITAGPFGKVAGAIGSFGRHMVSCALQSLNSKGVPISGVLDQMVGNETMLLDAFTGGSECQPPDMKKILREDR